MSSRKTNRKPAGARSTGFSRNLGVPPESATTNAADPFRAWLLAGMAALLVARPLYPSESAAMQGDGLAAVMLWLSLAVIWLLGAMGNRRFALRFGLVDAAVLALVAWHSLAAIYATAHGSPRPALNMLWEWVGLGMVYFLTRQLITTSRQSRAVVAVMISLTAAISAYGIWQCKVELPALQEQFKEQPDAELKKAELNYPPGTPLRELLEKRLANREPFGTFVSPNSLAAVLAPWLVIGVALAAFVWRRRLHLAAWIVCLAPIIVCLVLTRSRSGLIAAALGIVWLAAIRLRFRPRHIAVGAVAACLLLAATFFAVRNQPWFVKASTSFGFRVQYWQGTLALIGHRPWLGCGPGNFQDVYTQFKLPEASEEVADPHNFLLEVWATAGTPALLALLAVLGLFAWRQYRGRSSEVGVPASDLRPLTSGCSPPLPPDHWWMIPVGAIAGFLLALPLGLICSAPPSTASIVIGLPVAVVCLLLLWPWIRDGQLPRGLMGLGVAVLLIDLFTTEGIGMAGIAEMLWLLLALGQIWSAAIHRRFLADFRPFQEENAIQNQSGDKSPHSKFTPRWVVFAPLAAGLGLAFACYHTSYSRVLPCQRFEQPARHEYLAGQLASSRELLERAVEADPYSREARALLAQVDLEIWQSSLDAVDYAAFEANDELARKLAPESAAVWRASAQRYQLAFAKTDKEGRSLQPRALEQALASARRAVELYPSSANDHATLAEIYRQAGDEAAYRREARAAVNLDRRMVHEDKKLPPDLRRKLESAAEETRAAK